MMRAPIIAITNVRSGGRRAPSTVSSPSFRTIPNTAATWPCGQLRSISSCASALTSVSPRRMPRIAAICAAESADRLAKVRLRILPSSRHASRSYTAGGEVRFGTMSMNMGTLHVCYTATARHLHGKNKTLPCHPKLMVSQ